ncbi:MAG: DUF2273 domain-containing protein [Actinobacteria bacterium]|nr:DUF2273 domain-containing protein [Actinomycetota bacterium]
MWEDVFRDLLENHRGKILGGLIGLVFALMIIRFGFFWSIFIGVCVLVGYLIGKRMDDNKEDLVDVLDKFLPPGHR